MIIAAGVAIAFTLTAVPSPAFATVTTTTRGGTLVLDTLRSRCSQAAETRVSALKDATSLLAEVEALTAAHRNALSAMLGDDAAALEALRTKMQSDGDLATLTADCRSIFGGYRIFALVLPRTRLVAAADIAGAAADRLTKVAGDLDTAIAKASAAGRDTSAASSDLAAMRSKIDAARTAAAGVADHILGLTPADWNANHGVLTPARQALGTARTDLAAARALGGKVLADLPRGTDATSPARTRPTGSARRPALRSDRSERLSEQTVARSCGSSGPSGGRAPHRRRRSPTAEPRNHSGAD